MLDVPNAGDMPPEDESQPSTSELAKVLDSLTGTLITARKRLTDHGGEIAMRRLNRREYASTIRDLFGFQIAVEKIPDDNESEIFDTVGADQFFSSSHFDKYLTLGREIVRHGFDWSAQPRMPAMEFVVQGFNTLPQKNGAMSFTPHMNHRFTGDNYAARVRWFETHLKGTFQFPKTASTQLDLKTGDGVPRFIVKPDLSVPHRLKSVEVFYGYDRDTRARFWRVGAIERDGDVFMAECPVVELGEPLFAFANVTYETGTLLKMPRGYADSSLLTLRSECCKAFPDQMKEAGVNARTERHR